MSDVGEFEEGMMYADRDADRDGNNWNKLFKKGLNNGIIVNRKR